MTLLSFPFSKNMTVLPQPATNENILAAVKVLRGGGLVAFPTETVYGLGADAANPAAVKKIFQAKQRPADHPLIVHIASARYLADWAREIPPVAYALAESFWPGPLALVLPKGDKVPLEVTGGQQTVALRVPDNPVALQLLRAFAGGIAAPSANRFNQISPTLAEHVVFELGEVVDMILDGGACEVGLESTIVDLSGAQPALLRPGQITPEQLESVIKTPVLSPQQSTTTRAPGMLELHYAPRTPATLVAAMDLRQVVAELLAKGTRVGVMSRTVNLTPDAALNILAMPHQAEAYAHDLYAAMRTLDGMQLDVILVEKLPDSVEWMAINDRLDKATAGTAGILK